MKLLVATEKEPSFTARLTPNQIGELLAKCSNDQIRTALDAMTSYVSDYGTDDKKIVSMILLKEAGEKMKTILNNKGGKDD